ncbi:hypothetical protein C8R47DRAFT_1158713 [Mycena vitilis]|nr:hypothetical protein C8R47DRAFT_1158713 [Mycena vitilis]
MPPRELPGFYFDIERNRYFPLSSRPPPASSASTSTSQPASEAQEHAPPTRRRRQLWSSAGGTTAAGRAREAQRLLHTRFAATQRCCAEQVRWPFYGTASNILLCAFRTTPTRQFLGDELGWLYSRGRVEVSPHYRDADDSTHEEWGEWTPELCLAPDSQISAICTTSTRCVAVCFGPSTKICVQDAGMPERTALLHLSDVFDVRAASLQGSALVLGALRQAVLLPDIDVSAGVRKLPTRTDVFSVAQQENLVYTGTRAGAVLRFDTRTNKNNGQVLFESGVNNNSTGPGLAGPIQRSSVVHLEPTHGRQSLVAGCMDGRLATFDLRFVRPAAPPVVTYAGNPSSVSHSGGLGFAIDPAERFLFAAGADARLRGWALDSGVPVLPDAAASTISYTRPSDPKAPCNPFATRFAAPLSALQVVDDGQGDVLWASGGGVVLHWRLGV